MKDLVLMVTGGAKGIGYAVAQDAARQGAAVLLMDIDEEALAYAESRLKSEGAKVCALKTDVTDMTQIKQSVLQGEQELGPVSALVNSAGIAPATQYVDITPGEWDYVMNVNLKSMFLCVQAVIEGMKARKSGSIICISSMAGIAGSENAGAHYCASKAGIIGLVKYLSKAYAKYGITSNVVAPGPVETEMVRKLGEKTKQNMLNNMPMRRLGDPREIAALCTFLCSEKARFITGAVLEASGGQIVV